MADQLKITGFPILNIWRPFRSQISVLNDLTYIMPMHEQCVQWPIDVHSLILKSQSKMADQQEIMEFPILNIYGDLLCKFCALDSSFALWTPKSEQEGVFELPVLFSELSLFDLSN